MSKMTLSSFRFEYEFEDADHAELECARKRAWAGFPEEEFDEMEYDDPRFKKLSDEWDRRDDVEENYKIMKYFNVESRSDYHIDIQRVSIDELGDDFLDTNDLAELGIKDNEPGYYIDKGACHLALNNLAGAIPKGKVSTQIDDPFLLDILKDGNSPAALGLKGYTRSGDRLCKKKAKAPPPPQTEPKYSNFDTMMSVASCITDDKFGIGIEAPTGEYTETEERVLAVTAIKKLVSWKEMAAMMKPGNSVGWDLTDELKWVQLLWRDPSYDIKK